MHKSVDTNVSSLAAVATVSSIAIETPAHDEHIGFVKKRSVIQWNRQQLRQHNGCRNLKVLINGVVHLKGILGGIS